MGHARRLVRLAVGAVVAYWVFCALLGHALVSHMAMSGKWGVVLVHTEGK